MVQGTVRLDVDGAAGVDNSCDDLLLSQVRSTLTPTGSGQLPNDDSIVERPHTDLAAMQATIAHLMHTVADLQLTVRRQNDEIRQLQQWEFMTPQIPCSYWTSEYGMSGEHAIEMHKFLCKLKQKIFEMKRGLCAAISLTWSPDGRSNEVGQTFRAKILLPYWEELASALHSSRFKACTASNEYSRFDLINIAIGKEMRDLLAPGLKMNHFKSLWFQNNRFDHDGIAFVAYVIEHSPWLETLFLMDNPIESRDSARLLCNAVTHHPSLKRLVIIHCASRLPSDFLYPIMIVSDRLETIELDRNNICTLGKTNLADFLATNPSLKILKLRDNQFNDDDAILIANSLETNNTLTCLDLDANNITRIGKDAFLRITFNQLSLNSVAGCNHTCRVTVGHSAIFDGEEDLSLPSINNTYTPAKVKEMKILALISAPYEKCVSIHFLNGVSVGLMPRVLGFVQRYPEVAYNFPDHINGTLPHWELMSSLRPDTPQDDFESNEDKKQVDAGDEQLDVDMEEQWNSDENWAEYEEEYLPEEVDPMPALIKRLNIVFEILRGWQMPTGEPLYLFATA